MPFSSPMLIMFSLMIFILIISLFNCLPDECKSIAVTSISVCSTNMNNMIHKAITYTTILVCYNDPKAGIATSDIQSGSDIIEYLHC